MVVNIESKEDFQKKVTESHTALVDFWAPWCGPCKRMDPVLEAAAERLPGVGFYKINIDHHPELGTAHQVMSIPTFLLFIKGNLVGTKVGGMDTETLVLWVEQHVSHHRNHRSASSPAPDPEKS